MFYLGKENTTNTLYLKNRLIPIADKIKELPIYLVGIGEDTDYPVYRTDGFIYPQFFIVRSGKGLLKWNNEQRNLVKNDIFFIPKEISHSYVPITSDFILDWICFDGYNIDLLLAHYKFIDLFVFKPRTPSAFFSLHESMYNSTSRSYDVDRLSLLTYTYLIELHKQYESSKINSMSLIQLESIKLYMKQNSNLDLSLDKIAAENSISKYSLCKKFKQTYDISPYEYLISLRIQNAQNLLINTNYTSKKIAEIVGFHDNSFFIKTFKKRTNYSPHEFRKIHKK